ncbi:MAG: fimbrillin family protein [Bacteroides sp.]|nr:fimbrillin family protein [Bacteroides sp.]
MKNFYKHITCVGLGLGMSLGLFLTACFDNGTMHPALGTDEEWVPLRIAGATTGSGIGIETQTRVNTGTGVLDGTDKIGIYRKESTADSYTAITNRKFTHSTAGWDTDEQLLLNAKPATLVAYYPYSASGAAPLLLHSQLYDADAQAAESFCTAFTASSSDASVDLSLQRIYACIQVELTKGATVVGVTGNVSAIRFEGSGILPAGQLDITALITASLTIYDKVTPTPSAASEVNITGLSENLSSKLPVLMIPRTLNGDITITATIDGTEFKGKIAATTLCPAVGGTAAGILKEGVQYSVKLKVTNTGLTVGSISIEEWTMEKVDGDFSVS